ncbi:3-keto-5-aminohexanoate cleavage protein [Effusibacillus lacus]|uniref:3-keto-5-aminohexanoate cleavage protein n=1 Tax=Effusibacillus lacus TaxID=1348429 RepID=A0A292YKY2_9BACL|nr:3-keto-5-aminohexanoate cleavage protein [Effusibacillus lacus]TCS70477.1 3-keto-5-aminohexanoate cleavage enzyme [Effusibacillus lacus]GAX89569.1 3-keto-5-aminohexanoate cleavage protein [Effusibacillus lacus]
MEKLIITCALTGAEATKQDNPNLPVTPEEIAKAALEVRQAGASIVHLHARNEDGSPTQDKTVYAEIMRRIRETGNDIILQVSTGGAVGMTPEERIQPVTLRSKASDGSFSGGQATGLLPPYPEMASLTTGTVNFGNGVFLNTPSDIERFARVIQEHGVLPELEIFDAGMIRNALELRKKGLVPDNAPFDFVMGVAGGIPGTPRELLFLVESLPEGARWSVAGIGRAQLPLATMAILLGGHVRVGFEDNVYYAKGVLAESNAQLVARIVRLAKELGRAVAAPDEARHMLGIIGKK